MSANSHRSLGCVGVICDGAVRDIDEMTNAGFKALARRLCVGHAYTTPVSWGEPVECFGVRVEPGQLIHADKHGFLTIPPEDETGLLEAARFLDDNECNHLLPAARGMSGRTFSEMTAAFADSISGYTADLKSHFGGGGEYSAPDSVAGENEAMAQ